MASKIIIVISALIVATLAQRPSYAGRRPIGYPEMVYTQPATTTTTQNPNSNDLGNRFGEAQTSSSASTTTMRLPIEALGDQDLVNRLSQMPIDKQPFWYINWQALEANRNRPQTYPQKPNSFVDPAVSGFNLQKWA